MKNETHYRVALLAGGDSDERAISLKSGMSVQKALTSRDHTVVHLDPAIVDLAGIDWSQFDVAFLALHGQFGEDGQVQRILDEVNVPYTGSSAAASQLAFSKSAAKDRFLQFGVPTPSYGLLHFTDDEARIRKVVDEIGYPLVVKPDSQGSSLGISFVHGPEQLSRALRTCFQFDSFAVIETAIIGSEWTVGFFDDLLLPIIKIETDREFFDWHAKYEDDSTRYIFDHRLNDQTREAIEITARNACRSLGTSGMMRVDLRLDQNSQPWVLEINTIPGFTDHSLIPKAAARIGLSLGELCERAILACVKPVIPRPHLLGRQSLPRPSVRKSAFD